MISTKKKIPERAVRGTIRKGNITLILVGLVSVMIVYLFSLSRRLSGHTQILTLIDSSQIARYYLESYAGDVLKQVRLQVNTKQNNSQPNDFFTSFRDKNVTERELPFPGYRPCPLLENLERDLGITRIGTPLVKITGIKKLDPPTDLLVLDPKQDGKEKSGYLSIDCIAEFQKKKYDLTVRYPFKVVYVMTPVLKEFVLFCDQIHLEQKTPYPPEDKLNLLPIADGNLQENSSTGCGNPLVLMSEPPDDQRVERNGRVYLGDDSHGIFLNLSGEKGFRKGFFNDLWQISPRAFNDASPGDASFSCIPFFTRKNGTQLTLRGIPIPLNKGGHTAKLAVLGFCSDIDDQTNGIFSEASWKLDDFINPDPSFEKMKADRQSLTLASSLKLRGLNMESELDRLDGGASLKTYFGPVREIFGNVFARFFVLTFFEFPTGFGPLPYNSDPNYRPNYPQPVTNQPMYFEPKSGSYHSYMSRIVSGGDVPYNSPSQLNVPLNQHGGPRPGYPTLLNNTHFKPLDLTQLRKSFDQFGKEWFKFEKKKATEDSIKSVQSRICAYFPSQRAFEDYVGLSKDRFWVNGVVYIDGPLNITTEIKTKDVKGGIILVNGPITLGNFTRGLTGFKSDSEFQALMKMRENLKQDEIVSFVSISGDLINLVGDKHIGVQFISLKPEMGAPADQIKWSGGSEIVLLGGIAVSTLNLKERVRDFKKSPLLYYVPCMSDADPALAVSLQSFMGSYKMKLAN
ncbi:MAG: hypothetical protein HQM08_04215 [Candidatus Riflebacteria bacterium]|nr:hypothetical protein [Candidatus Riflebacteria bacterium]